MAESRSQQFIKLNLSVLNVLKERCTSDRDLSNKIDWLTKECYQVDRVEFKRPQIPAPNDPALNNEKAHQYENPMLLKFPADPKHTPLQLRASSPFEDKSRLANVINEPRVPGRVGSPFEEISKHPTPPHLRISEPRSNLQHESSPALPPRSEASRSKPENEFKPIAARPETPDYFNIPKQAPGSNNPKYTTLKSRENKTQPIKVLEPLPMRFKDQPPQPENPNYVNVPDYKAPNAYFREGKESGVTGEVKFNPYNNERVSPYETKGEPKKPLPLHGVGMNFEDTGEGRTIIDGEIGHRERPGFHAPLNMPTSPPIYRPPLPPPYMSQGSQDLEEQKMIHVLCKPELPPKGLPKIGNNNFATNPDTNPSYVNVLDQLKERTRREHFFDTITKPDGDNRTEESGEQMKGVRPPVMKEQGPQKSQDDYGYLILQKDNEVPSPGIYEEISDTRGEGLLGVFNMRELINEKTELLGSDNVAMKRGVLADKMTSKEESEFYELISNKAVFFLFITDDNVLTQELLSLSNALYIELHNVLAPFYKFNFQKLKVSLGPAVGILETANSNTKKKGVFQNMMGKKGETLDIGKSLLEMRITTSHIIYLSQSGAEFDEASFERYMNERDQNSIDHFHRSFIPLIQGAQPLSKRRVSDLTVYLGSIYKFKDFQRIIPEAYKHDTEMLADITTSLNLCNRSSPEELMPQVIELAEGSKLRNSVYFRVKVNNKMPKKMNDTILGISPKNIHLISLSQNEDIVCYIWASADIERWSNIGGLTIEFKDGQKLLLSSPENEKIIHEILKMRVKPKKMLVNY